MFDCESACKLPNSYQERLIISFVGPEKNQKYKDQISGFGKNFLGEIEFKGDLNESDLHIPTAMQTSSA